MLFWIITVMIVAFIFSFRIMLDISRDIDSQIKECDKMKKWAKDMLEHREKENAKVD